VCAGYIPANARNGKTLDLETLAVGASLTAELHSSVLLAQAVAGRKEAAVIV